ncbi:MAG TPA: acyl-ACP desaturase [Acidimicrobiales bacterium]|nr:acyl-ACP desaturase [Acidimicrobiales bacterium]
MDATRITAELVPVVETLLERHLATTHEWFPHEYVPWGRGKYSDGDQSWGDDPLLDPAARVALTVNLLTEDNLPLYFAELNRLGKDDAWGEWARRWTAEEGRHSIVIRDYLMVTRALDPVALERARMRQVTSGSVPAFDDVTDALVYTTLQELATRISHRNTGKLLTDAVGVAVMNRVASDENLHHLFYRDLASAAIDLAPSDMVRAIDRVVRNFTMPGTDIDDFARHARTMAKAGVYSLAIHHDQILVPTVLQRWGLEDMSGLDDDAERARARTLRYITRLGKVSRRVEGGTRTRGEKESVSS